MSRVRKEPNSTPNNKSRLPITVEGQEDLIVSLATDLAVQRLRDGSASNQLVVQCLKMGSTKERLEKEILSEQKKLISAKTEALESSKNLNELYSKAIEAMRTYSGAGEDDEEDEEY